MNVGQPVQVKVETFPFTIYGIIDGQVLTISHDAIQEKGGLVYSTRVSMVEQKLVNLMPGVSVTVEIKTGTRRTIEYFLSPLLKSAQESIRVR